MTRVTEKDSIELAHLGLPVSDNSNMDFVALSYQKFDGKPQLSLYMVCQDYIGAAVPLVELIKYAMQYHPEVVEEATQGLKTGPQGPTIETLLAGLPALPGFNKLVEEVAALPNPIPQDGRIRVLLKDWGVRDAINYTSMGDNTHNCVVVLPKTLSELDEAHIIIEGWGQGMSDENLHTTSFSDLMPGVKEMVRKEIELAAQRAA
jgi:hypothetical protein